MRKCINLKFKLKGGLYCKLLKKDITLDHCTACKDKKYRSEKLTKRTKELGIKKSIKMKVWERDNHRCIFCGRLVNWYYANSHFIKRSQGGLGIEENILTNCENCHHLFDDTIKRNEMFDYAYHYLEMKYPNWHDIDLTYKK